MSALRGMIAAVLMSALMPTSAVAVPPTVGLPLEVEVGTTDPFTMQGTATAPLVTTNDCESSPWIVGPSPILLSEVARMAEQIAQLGRDRSILAALQASKGDLPEALVPVFAKRVTDAERALRCRGVSP